MKKNADAIQNTSTGKTEKVRLDKWLWAARFFKTRALAKQAIDGGKVHINGQRGKSSRDVTLESELTITAGWDERTVIVTGLSDQRRDAKEASKLYRETETSILLRERRAAERKAANAGFKPSQGKPSKKQRRHIHRFKQNQD